VHDSIMWLATQRSINHFRTQSLGLPAIRVLGGDGSSPYTAQNVPFTHLFSPALAPPPHDWGRFASAVGYIHPPSAAAAAASTVPTVSIASSGSAETTSGKRGQAQEQVQGQVQGHGHGCGQDSRRLAHEAPALVAFLEHDPSRPPVFFGFGSMSVSPATEESRVLAAILQGCERLGVRVVVQASQGFMDCSTPASRTASTALFEHTAAAAVAKAHATRHAGAHHWRIHDALLLFEGPLDHRLLFPHCCATVHHGGSGTVHTSLRAGRPTWCLPFFGDQYFWGFAVARCGAGPSPVSIGDVTSDQVVSGLRTLFHSSTVASARRLAATMDVEEHDACRKAIDAIYSHLPTSRMVCEVSLFLDGMGGGGVPALRSTHAARYYCAECGLAMSAGVAQLLHAHNNVHSDHSIWLCRPSEDPPEAAPPVPAPVRAQVPAPPPAAGTLTAGRIDVCAGPHEAAPAGTDAVWTAFRRARAALRTFNALKADPRAPCLSPSDLTRAALGTVGCTGGGDGARNLLLALKEHCAAGMDFATFAYTFYRAR
jgi:hypothetical protein